MSSLELETQHSVDDVNDDTKLHCCIILSNGLLKDTKNYHITNVSTLSWLIWNLYSTTSKSISRVLYRIEDSEDVENFTSPVASRKDLVSLLSQFCCGTNNGEHQVNSAHTTIYLLSHSTMVCSFVCLFVCLFFVVFTNRLIFVFVLLYSCVNEKHICSLLVIMQTKSAISKLLWI